MKFLDGTTLLLQNQSDDPPIGPDTINMVRGKGMLNSAGNSGGDLYVVWKLEMPDAPFDEDTKAKLRELLGAPKLDDNTDRFKDAEEVKLEPTTAGDRRRRQRQSQDSHSSNSGDDSGTNCRQM